MSKPESPSTCNRHHWEERASLHPGTGMYQRFFERLRQGGDCLLPIEKRELGDLTGRTLLHLQCHLGQDSLSLARLGATVTGVDFSPAAIEYAREMSRELDIPADFVCGGIESLTESPDLSPRLGSFDVVFASYGVLIWIDDLAAWMSTVAAFLRPGGFFYIVDGHPFAHVFGDENDPVSHGFRVSTPYFRSEALRYDEAGSYAEPGAATTANVTYEWAHRLGEIVNATIRAGLQLDFLNEHAEGYCPGAGRELRDDGSYRLPPSLEGQVPLVYSLRATKTGGN